MISKRAFEMKCGESNSNNTKQKWISPTTKISKQQAVVLNPNRTTTPATTLAMQAKQAKEKEAIVGRQHAASNRNSASSSCSSKPPLPPPPPATTLMMGTCRGPSTPAKNFNSKNKQQQQQKLIKKAFVRFEDYLDLNEENMRRSCKKLMNHLYSEPTTNATTSAAPFASAAESTAPLVVVAPAISCQSQSAPKNDQCHTGQSTGASNDNECVASSNSMIPVSAATATQQYQPSISPQTATNGKSYLRSQYERRQLRQIQLVNKVQHEKVKMFEHVNGGANVSLDQQDLVERSHELSKRRFFEKLERRESMKNTNLNSAQTHEHQRATSTKQQPTNDQERKRLQETSEQKRVAAAAAESTTTADSNENELLLKVYQSIELKDNISEEGRGQEAKNDTLGRLDRAQAATCCDNKEMGGELIGFYTPSLQSPAAAGERERLIEISDEQIKQKQRQHRPSEETISKNATLARLVESGFGRSPFEIKVPLLSASFSSSNQPLGFISSELLVVKQVNLDTTESGSLLQVADNSAGGLPNWSGHAAMTATIQLASNKTTTPHVEFTDNKAFSALAEQINGQMTNIKTMVPPREFSSDQSKLVESKSSDSDNQHQAVGISSTISCGNNNTEMETISSEETTGKVQSGTSERSAGQCSEQKPAIEFGGALNHAEDHDVPETGIHVGQSGGADGNSATATATTAATITNLNSSHPVQAQSAAQMQQQQVLGPKTTITKAEIRDVLPKATNEINRIEVIVSAEKNSTEKVTSIGEQLTNEVHQQQHGRALPETFTFENISEYANPAAKAHETQQVDNVNHDSSGVQTIAENIDLMGGDSNLIESLVTHSKLAQKKSSTSSSLEEDGSSCSSSGCGASVSVTGSSDGCSASINVALGPKHELGDFKRPISQGNKTRNEPECNPLYDSACVSHWPRSQMVNQYPDYKQLVGPDRAYPSRRMTLVENHCYASVLIQSNSTPFNANKASHEREFGGGYANLPRNKAPLVEYSTIHPIGENGSQKRLQNSYSETSLSNHSYSTSTANSGGFSALPPAQVGCSATNNRESSNSLAEVTERKSSLFKRFGSLVSKAFSSTAAQSVTSKINESSAPDCPSAQTEKSSNTNTNNCCSSKPALVIEKDLQVVEETRERAQLDEADLIILPTKHVNQRTQLQTQHQGKNPTAALRHDDRLSRGRKHSRKVEHIDSSSAALTSSSSYSSSSSSYDVRHHIERPKRADSLSDELESLMSRSESNYRIQGSKLFRKRASSSSKNQPTKSSRRIDIDCVSPTKNTDKRSRPFDSSKTSNSPRSLLRLFSSSSQRAAESTPNLIHSLSRRRPSAQSQLETNANPDYADEQQPQLASGFWGLSNLIGNNHATKGESSPNKFATSKTNRKSRTNRLEPKPEAGDLDYPMYASLQPYAAGYRLHPPSAFPREQEEQTLDKYQSSSLYQNLLRNYTKRRHRHGHHHHHHHHNHHRAYHHSSQRHAHHTARCAQSCGQQNCNLSSSSTSLSYGSNEKLVVWGQLIKINKSDGSQVVELQRPPGKPWGFFVARGAINNTKGVFISRMHDNVTSDSLTGLLSIGDCILAIDECPIEPDYDILRVNQLISKKSKILLTVKPFKG